MTECQVTKGTTKLLFIHELLAVMTTVTVLRGETVETFHNMGQVLRLLRDGRLPTTLKLQYQYISHRTNQVVNIGSPVAFGESTGWEQVLLLKLPNEIVTAGSRRIDYRIKVIDSNGNVVGDLQVRNASGAMVSYADYWTGTIGRRVHHIFCGLRAATPVSAVRLFTAL